MARKSFLSRLVSAVTKPFKPSTYRRKKPPAEVAKVSIPSTAPVVPPSQKLVVDKIVTAFPHNSDRGHVTRNVRAMTDDERKLVSVSGPAQLRSLAQAPADRVIDGELRNPFWYH